MKCEPDSDGRTAEHLVNSRKKAAGPIGLPGRWRPFLTAKVGGLPLPIYLVLAALLAVLAVKEQGSAGLAATIVMIPVGAFTLAEIGRRLPIVRATGLETIAAVFVPSYLVYAKWIDPGSVDRAKKLFESTDIIGLFITVLIIGSIVSIERRDLIAGLAKIALPLCVGSVVAAGAGVLIGVTFGLKPFDALFLVVTPVMGGGVTAGALPLSIGYASVLGTSQGAVFAGMLPAVILGNFAAMIFAGLLGFSENRIWQNPPAGRGEKLLGPANVGSIARNGDENRASDAQSATVAAIVMIAVYFAGIAASRMLSFPAPLAALTLATILQLVNILPRRLRAGIVDIYRFFIAAFTYPMLFAVGMLLTPWEKLIEGFALVNVAMIFAVVGSLSFTGFFASRWVGLDPVDGAVITVTRAAMGGTGDIAILSAGHRMELMAFAQISTRIGGAATVAAALIAIEHFGR
jgi:malate:Na+ symporter